MRKIASAAYSYYTFEELIKMKKRAENPGDESNLEQEESSEEEE